MSYGASSTHGRPWCARARGGGRSASRRGASGLRDILGKARPREERPDRRFGAGARKDGRVERGMRRAMNTLCTMRARGRRVSWYGSPLRGSHGDPAVDAGCRRTAPCARAFIGMCRTGCPGGERAVFTVRGAVHVERGAHGCGRLCTFLSIFLRTQTGSEKGCFFKKRGNYKKPRIYNEKNLPFEVSERTLSSPGRGLHRDL